MAGAVHASSRHIILGHLANDRSARDAHVMRQHHHGHRQHGIHQTGPQDGDDDDGQQQAGQRQDDVHQAHHANLEDTAEIARCQAQNRTDDDRQGNHGHANGQRQARTMDQARQDVTTDGIGAEPVGAGATGLPGRRLEKDGRVGQVGRVGRNQRCQRGQQQHCQHDRQTRYGTVVGTEIAPELAQWLRWFLSRFELFVDDKRSAACHG